MQILKITSLHYIIYTHDLDYVALGKVYGVIPFELTVIWSLMG